MNKQELIAALSTKADLSKADALRAVGALEIIIQEELVAGGEVTLASTGKFKVKETQARTGRNPATGEPIEIPAGRKITFTPAKTLKEAIAG
ncbi:HU family DNA-binding protein [Chromobacterium haemolyticum]|nr:HU family DNA-binding protein [Chromobacterium haemolyticum]